MDREAGGASRRLIVNADDYGLTAGVNRAIEEAHARGVVTSTTVLVGGEAAAAVEELPRRCPDLDVGLHLNLTLGAPAAGAARVPTLVDGDGQLLPRGRLITAALRRRIDAGDVRREAEAQLAQLRAFGIEPTHWDSHQDVAGVPLVARAAGDAIAAGGVRRARNPRVWVVAPGRSATAARWRWRLRTPTRLVGEALRARSARILARRFALPAWQVYPDTVDATLDVAARWRLLLERLPSGVVEAVAHPGHVEDALVRLTPGLVAEREVDLAVLGDPDLRGRLLAAGVRVHGFRDLEARR